MGLNEYNKICGDRAGRRMLNCLNGCCQELTIDRAFGAKFQQNYTPKRPAHLMQQRAEGKKQNAVRSSLFNLQFARSTTHSPDKLR
ncbi:MAG: hypothetical protein WBA89_05375 [Microcoleus sp.]|uniref:hypothetical protein n=1 Tax=Microcoleus sp. TaxID=44472 RepID=UPI003C78EC14